MECITLDFGSFCFKYVAIILVLIRANESWSDFKRFSCNLFLVLYQALAWCVFSFWQFSRCYHTKVEHTFLIVFESNYIKGKWCEASICLLNFLEWVNQMSANGGGDFPEAVTSGLYDAANLSYRDRATKICIWIGRL